MKKKNLFFVILFMLVCILTGLNSIGRYAETKKSTGSTAQYLAYENKKFGFTLQFPISWKGYYIIHESNRDYIEVCFVGKSKTSKNITSGSKRINGLTMFFIGNEESVKDDEFIDSVRKIGTSHRVNYYYFTSTDYPIGILLDVSKSDTEDKDEREKAKKDFQKSQQMEEDIVNILKTFKAK